MIVYVTKDFFAVLRREHGVEMPSNVEAKHLQYYLSWIIISQLPKSIHIYIYIYIYRYYYSRIRIMILKKRYLQKEEGKKGPQNFQQASGHRLPAKLKKSWPTSLMLLWSFHMSPPHHPQLSLQELFAWNFSPSESAWIIRLSYF